MNIDFLNLISKIVFCCVISVNHVYADGPVGDHVNDLQAHLDEYAGEIAWLLDQVEGILKRYEDTGFDSAQPKTILDHWEANMIMKIGSYHSFVVFGSNLLIK